MLRKWAFLTLLATAGVPTFADACPRCKEAVEAGDEVADGDDPYREGLAYNRSILLMMGMPYLLLGGITAAIYRSSRLTAAARSRT